eukprot:1641453-Amphidinium_carterae.3
MLFWFCVRIFQTTVLADSHKIVQVMYHQVLTTTVLIPESPTFLMKKGRVQDAKAMHFPPLLML